MKTKGFSVMELVVVSAIFVILFAISVNNYRAAGKTETMRITGHQLTTDLSWLQTATITGTSSDHGMGSAYGVVFEKNSRSYILFRDDDATKTFDSKKDKLIRKVEMPADFIVSSLKLGGVEIDQMTTIFLPPRPIVYSNGELSKAVYVKIDRVSGGDKSLVVEIDPITGRSKQNFVTVSEPQASPK